MQVITHNNITLAFEHIPLVNSGNVLVGAKYITRLYLVEGGRKYNAGEWDGKLEEAEVKARFEEIINSKQERSYGTQRTPFRKELSNVRDRTRLGLRIR